MPSVIDFGSDSDGEGLAGTPKRKPKVKRPGTPPARSRADFHSAEWKNPPSAEGGGPIWVDVRLAAKGCSLDLQTQAGSLTPHQCACPPSAHCSCLEERVQLVLLVEAEWSDDRLAGWARGSLPPRLWGPQLKLFPEAAGDEAIASVARNSGRAPSASDALLRQPGRYRVSDADGQLSSGGGAGAVLEVRVGEGGACGVELLDGGRDYASGDELLLRDAELGGGGAADVTLAVGRVKRGLRPLPSVTRLLNRKAGRMRRTFRWEGAPMQNPLDALRAEARVRSATQVVSDMSSIEVRLWSASNWETLDGAFAGMGQGLDTLGCAYRLRRMKWRGVGKRRGEGWALPPALRAALEARAEAAAAAEGGVGGDSDGESGGYATDYSMASSASGGEDEDEEEEDDPDSGARILANADAGASAVLGIIGAGRAKKSWKAKAEAGKARRDAEAAAALAQNEYDKGRYVSHWRVTAKKLALRASFEVDSERVGELVAGDIVGALEAREHENTQHLDDFSFRAQGSRMRVRLDGGWASVTSEKGAELMVEEPQAHAEYEQRAREQALQEGAEGVMATLKVKSLGGAWLDKSVRKNAAGAAEAARVAARDRARDIVRDPEREFTLDEATAVIEAHEEQERVAQVAGSATMKMFLDSTDDADVAKQLDAGLAQGAADLKAYELVTAQNKMDNSGFRLDQRLGGKLDKKEVAKAQADADGRAALVGSSAAQLLAEHEALDASGLGRKERSAHKKQHRQLREQAAAAELPEEEAKEGEDGNGGRWEPGAGVAVVRVIRAYDLEAADDNGLSDPYVEVETLGADGRSRSRRVLLGWAKHRQESAKGEKGEKGDEGESDPPRADVLRSAEPGAFFGGSKVSTKASSRTVKRTLNPQFEENLVVCMESQSTSIKLKVMDYDAAALNLKASIKSRDRSLMQDDPLGVAQFSALGLVELSEVTMTLPLQGVSSGTVEIGLTWCNLNITEAARRTEARGRAATTVLLGSSARRERKRADRANPPRAFDVCVDGGILSWELRCSEYEVLEPESQPRLDGQLQAPPREEFFESELRMVFHIVRRSMAPRSIDWRIA